MAAKTMLAAVWSNPGPDFKIEIVERPIPTADDDEILVRLNTTGLCHSDLYIMSKVWNGWDAQVQTVGHEGAGVVEEVGAKVTNWKKGDRVGVKPISWVCRSCDMCTSDLEQHCSQARFPGITVQGTYQQYLTVPASYATRIPEGVDDFTAAPIMCSGTTAFCSIKNSGLRVGQWAVVPGAGGGVGHMALQIAKAQGIRCIAIDGGDSKREMCLRLGAEEYIDFTSTPDVVACVHEITGGGAHGVIVTASHPSSYKQAPEFLRVGGTVMCLGMPPSGSAMAGADPNVMIAKSLTVKGTMVGNLGDCAATLDLAARGLLRPEISKFGIQQIPEAIKMLHDGKIVGRAVVDLWA